MRQLGNEKATPFPRQHNSPKRKGWNERVTRGPQGAGGSKLQAEDFFCFLKTFFPSLLMKPVLPKINSFFFSFFFFLFSNLGLIMAQQTNIYVNCFMAWNNTPCDILSQKCILWEGGLVKLPQPSGASFI